ncbi:959_t:CDS:10 [Entrophospora sp. SA101]|nr:959_t:CDS:10 [Entrophospora sp. SA101]
MSKKHLITQDPKKLRKLHEFAIRGGIGKGIAIHDTLADTEDDLMFFTGDTVTILKHIKDEYFLGYCEGVIGKFKGSAIKFNDSPKRQSNFLLPSDAIQNHQNPIIIANPPKRSSSLLLEANSNEIKFNNENNNDDNSIKISDTASILEYNNPTSISILQSKDQSIGTDHHDTSNNFSINKRNNRQSFYDTLENITNGNNHATTAAVSTKLSSSEIQNNENNNTTNTLNTPQIDSFIESDQNKNIAVPTFKIDLVSDTETKSPTSEQFSIKENPKVATTSKDLKNDETKEPVLKSSKIETSIVMGKSAIESLVTTEPPSQPLPPSSPLSSPNSQNQVGVVKPKKEQILTIDEYGFVYDISEEKVLIGADRIKKLVRLGIPESLRGKAWQFMAGADKLRRPGYYDRDIHRCYPDHIQFRKETGFGQEDLHDVLKAYAHYNPSIGYCQGMGRLVGMMLMQMPVEDSFWLLVATIEKYMVGYFTPNLTQIRINSVIFEQLLIENYPKLAQHLAENDVIPLIYVTQWFMTLFTMTLPWASVLRVWDMFYFEGVNLFYRIGLAIMECSQDYILKECPTSSEILEFLLHIPHEFLTPDLLLEAAFKIKIKKRVRKLTKKIEAMEKGKDNDYPNINNLDFINGTVNGVEFKLIGE